MIKDYLGRYVSAKSLPQNILGLIVKISGRDCITVSSDLQPEQLESVIRQLLEKSIAFDTCEVAAVIIDDGQV